MFPHQSYDALEADERGQGVEADHFLEDAWKLSWDLSAGGDRLLDQRVNELMDLERDVCMCFEV